MACVLTGKYPNSKRPGKICRSAQYCWRLLLSADSAMGPTCTVCWRPMMPSRATVVPLQAAPTAAAQGWAVATDSTAAVGTPSWTAPPTPAHLSNPAPASRVNTSLEFTTAGFSQAPSHQDHRHTLSTAGHSTGPIQRPPCSPAWNNVFPAILQPRRRTNVRDPR